MLIKFLLGVSVFFSNIDRRDNFWTGEILILTDLLILPSLKIELSLSNGRTKFDTPKEKSFMRLKQVKETAFFFRKIS